MKKKHAKRLKQIASQMGEIEIQIFTDEPIMGWELLLSGYGKQHGADKIIPGARYSLPVPTFICQSSEKELKRNFTQKGEKGVYHVVRKEFDKRFSIKK